MGEELIRLNIEAMEAIRTMTKAQTMMTPPTWESNIFSKGPARETWTQTQTPKAETATTTISRRIVNRGRRNRIG